MKIIHAKTGPDFRVELQFDNDETGVDDLSSYVGRGVFEAWNVPGVFEQLTITPDGALEWPGQIDMCPDAHYLRMMSKQPEDLFPAFRNRMTHA